MNRNKPKSVKKEPVGNRTEIGEKIKPGNYGSLIEDIYQEPGPENSVNPM